MSMGECPIHWTGKSGRSVGQSPISVCRLHNKGNKSRRSVMRFVDIFIEILRSAFDLELTLWPWKWTFK